MHVEINNIWPDETFDFEEALDHPDNPRVDDRPSHLFADVESSLSGKVIFHSDSNIVEFPETTFVFFARGLFSTMFRLNFFKTTTKAHTDMHFTEGLALELAVAINPGYSMHFSIALDEETHTVTLEIGLGPGVFIIHNGQKKGPVSPDIYEVVTISYPLHELNKLAGMFYEKAVGYFEDRLDHIDGIREHFFIYPFIEGFPDILHGDEDAD